MEKVIAKTSLHDMKTCIGRSHAHSRVTRNCALTTETVSCHSEKVKKGSFHPEELLSSSVVEVTPDQKCSSHEYNQLMKRQMKNPYEYHHDLGN